MKNAARLLLLIAFMNYRFAIASHGQPVMKSAQNVQQPSGLSTDNNEKMTVWIARFCNHKHPLKALKTEESRNSTNLCVAEVDVTEHKADLQELKKTATKEWGISKKIQLLRLGILVELIDGRISTGNYGYYVQWEDGCVQDPIYYGSECMRLFLAIDEDEEKALKGKIANNKKVAVPDTRFTTKQQRKTILKSQQQVSLKPKMREAQTIEYSLAPVRYKPGSQKQLRVQKQAIKALKKYRNSYTARTKTKHLKSMGLDIVKKQI